MTRGFEIVSSYTDKDLRVPYRSTQQAAGYDFESAVDFTVPSIWKLNFLKVLWAIRHQETVSAAETDKAKAILKPFLIPTGIKAYMGADEVLILANRSSNPLKRGLVIPNGIGVIDADYYNNDSNEGEIFMQVLNFGLTDVLIKKGDRIGQGIFLNYLTADNEAQPRQQRKGGFGSSGR
ncbi:dUTP diphosphatase [Secundilactobacillus paracollinoides]|uniref:dUTP diphosphatase n=1 Tax=Secundilactobacillus paracollinoides TaxID=240427 RepID=UPI0006D0046D|nr:dUTP diphosphatase [Secundilactobacillus paracollinoides]ANZ64089.1 dUTP diphosphatase [Secundilactobacillus paracollinoides]KRL78568.1 dUTP diphosphatase [Secundilactobacillus paracollinoides DSM 15502 = JCM 11969]